MNVIVKRKIEVEDFLCLLIIICPVLDIVSFIFRNTFETSISPSTILRPIIPIGVMIYLFLKKELKLSILFYLFYKIFYIVYIVKSIKVT